MKYGIHRKGLKELLIKSLIMEGTKSNEVCELSR